MNRFLIAVMAAFIIPSIAVAQPATTQPNANGMVISTCGSGLPVTGGGSGNLLLCGTRQGNTSKYLSVSGTLTSGNCLESDASGNAIDAGSACGSGAGGGTSQADGSTFTYGTTLLTPIGGVFNSSFGTLSSGQTGAAAMTADRMLYVNLGKVGGTAIALGQTTMSASLPVAIANNQSALSVNPGTAANWSVGATGSAVPANGIYNGGQIRTSEQTAGTNGNLGGLITDTVGKLIVIPYANKENFVSGNINVTTATNTSLIAAAGSGIKIYLTGFSCANTGASNSLLQFTSGSAGTVIWQTINPTLSGTSGTISPPVATAANTALFVTTGTASPTQYCSVTGYTGT